MDWTRKLFGRSKMAPAMSEIDERAYARFLQERMKMRESKCLIHNCGLPCPICMEVVKTVVNHTADKLPQEGTGNHTPPQAERIVPPPPPSKKRIDWSKPVWTIDNHDEVEVVTTKARDKNFPVRAYIGNSIRMQSFTLDGALEDSNGAWVVENKPEMRTVWINVYVATEGCHPVVFTQHMSETEAKLNAGPKAGIVGMRLDVPVKG
jgi:hypothetical protein